MAKYDTAVHGFKLRGVRKNDDTFLRAAEIIDILQQIVRSYNPDDEIFDDEKIRGRLTKEHCADALKSLGDSSFADRHGRNQ